MLAFAICLILLVLFIELVKPNKLNPDENNYHVQVVAHSRGRLSLHLPIITYYLVYPRFIHAEMMTHKDFSRSASSSRAIPVKKIISQVWNNPAMPIHWGINQAGMQASTEFTGFKRNLLRNLWQLAGRLMCCVAWVMMKIGLHKQVANRMLEPWQLMHVTLTTCKLANFFHLRIHKDAQPEIKHLASLMQVAERASTPKILHPNEWHLPWIQEEDKTKAWKYAAETLSDLSILELLKRMSAARCARSSYAAFDGDRSVEKDLATNDKLVNSKPVHASPCEHQATPDTLIKRIVYKESAPAIHEEVWEQPHLHGNLTGYIQYRNTIADHYIPDTTKT